MIVSVRRYFRLRSRWVSDCQTTRRRDDVSTRDGQTQYLGHPFSLRITRRDLTRYTKVPDLGPPLSPTDWPNYFKRLLLLADECRSVCSPRPRPSIRRPSFPSFFPGSREEEGRLLQVSCILFTSPRCDDHEEMRVRYDEMARSGSVLGSFASPSFMLIHYMYCSTRRKYMCAMYVMIAMRDVGNDYSPSIDEEPTTGRSLSIVEASLARLWFSTSVFLFALSSLLHCRSH